MTRALRYPDGLLRGRPTWVGSTHVTQRLAQAAAMVVVFGLIYGGVMGAFGLGAGRWLQVIYAAVKVPLLLLATSVLSLPSFFVLNTLMGLRADFGQAVRALVATQAGLTIILASLAPLTAVWYASSNDYEAAIVFNAIMFGVASLAAQVLLRRFYRPLIERDARHRLLLRAWLVIYAFVGIQMGWVLRPFVGKPEVAVTFFREGAWGNGYVELVRKIAQALGY